MARRIIGKLIETGRLSKKARNITFDDGILMEHNHQPYIDLVDTMEKDGRACAINATDTGKMYLAIKWLKDNPNKSFVYIAPNWNILSKFMDTILETFFSEKEVQKLKYKTAKSKLQYINRKLGFNLKMYTYSKINTMGLSEMQKINADCIVLDEFHRCGADHWGKSINRFLRVNGNAKVMGLSATPIRPSDGKNMVEELFDGKIATELTLIEALERNILPTPVMINAIYSFKDEIVNLQSRLDAKKYNPQKLKEIDEKLKQIKQLIGKSGGISKIFESYIKEIISKKGKEDVKMVVFCKDIADRDRKMDECKTWFPKGMKIKKYSITSNESENLIALNNSTPASNNPAKKIKTQKLRYKVIDTFEQDNSKGIKLLFAVDILNEGLHIKNLDGVIMLRDTSSNIVFLQQLGRALAVSKDRQTPPLVFDLVNNIEVLNEDIAEYNKILRKLTNGAKDQEESQNINFVIQKQIIDIIQYLKDISYTFEDRIAPLIDYYEQHGTISNIVGGKNETVHTFNGNTYHVGILINSLRREYDSNKLDESEINMLERMGMIWDPKASFRSRIAPLVDYYDKYGTIANIGAGNTPIKHELDGKFYNLSNLMHALRKEYKAGKLDDIKIKTLESMGMVWILRQDVSWERKLEVLQAYASDVNAGNGSIGNIQKSSTYVYQDQTYPIGQWRTNFITNRTLGVGEEKERRIKQLNDLGIVWNKSEAVPWEKKVEVLSDFARNSSDGTIGQIITSTRYVYEGEEYPIGQWRAEFRKGKCLGSGEEKERRIKQLNDLGIVWNRSEAVPWEKKMEVLKVYKDSLNNENGNVTRPKQKEKFIYQGVEYPIGQWCSDFVNGIGLGSNEEREKRIQQLIDLGFNIKISNTPRNRSNKANGDLIQEK